MRLEARITDTESGVTARTAALFREQQHRTFVRTDRLFACLMVLQWLAGIAAAIGLSPRTWSGSTSQVHPHLWAALLLGGALTLYPVSLVWKRPGTLFTRHVIAASQLLMSGLLIHLTGGRIETHFHVFGSLAFLAFYRDWRVLLTGTLITAADHLLRGMLWPQSVYGIQAPEIWRWLEHAGWVIFEDVFLVISCIFGLRELRALCERDAALEANNLVLEHQVETRTQDLEQTNDSLREQIRDREQAEAALRIAHAKTTHILESIGDAFFTLDTGWQFTYVNTQAERLLRFTQEALLGQPIHAVFPDVVGSRFELEAHRAVSEQAKVTFVEYYLPHAIWVEVSAYPSSEGLSVYLRDVTAGKVAEEELRRSEASLAEAQRVARLGSYEYRIDTGEITWSQEIYRLFDRDPALGPPSSEELMSYYHPEDKERLLAARQRAFEDGQPYECDIRVRQRDGSYRWCRSVARPLCDAEGNPQGVMGTLMDIHDRKLAERQLESAKEWLEQVNLQLESTNLQLEFQIERVNEQAGELERQKSDLQAANTQLEDANTLLEALATHDGLTGLKNHRTFQERLTEEFTRSRRYNTPLSLILLDVDRFKMYNDMYGHPAGDMVLKTLAQILRNAVRDADLVARYGGEEFVVILPDTDAQGAREAAERYRITLEEAPWPERAVTASFGVATLMPATPDPSALIAEADGALYCSKQRGRNCVTHAADAIEENASAVDLSPYKVLIQRMLDAQTESLVSASEWIESTLIRSHEATVESWSHILDLRDKETEGHSARVTEMTVKLARNIGMNAEEVRYACWGALLHDIGKMGVPDPILLKAGPLTEEERMIMQRHTDIAYEMLSPIEFLKPALDIPYCHHEKWDGTGYPRGLKGDEIPLAARLFAVIDVWDALRSDRPYREAWSEERIRAHLLEQAGTHFDPNAVRAFLQMLDEDQAPVQ